MDPRPVRHDADAGSAAAAAGGTLTARHLAAALGLASLAVCLLAPAVFFRGSLGEEGMKSVFLIASVSWFAAASYWSARG
jgi:hypothetical protein